MAAAIFELLVDGKHQALSAGYGVSEKAGEKIHEMVISCMAEKGCDISRCVRKPLTEKIVDESDKIIVMKNKGDTISPLLRKRKNVEYWEIDDPESSPLEFHRMVRDFLEDKVKKLVATI